MSAIHTAHIGDCLIRTKFPCCKGVATFDMPVESTAVYDRTCRKCHARWRIVLRPIKHEVHYSVHAAEWNCTRGAKEAQAERAAHRVTP